MASPRWFRWPLLLQCCLLHLLRASRGAAEEQPLLAGLAATLGLSEVVRLGNTAATSHEVQKHDDVAREPNPAPVVAVVAAEQAAEQAVHPPPAAASSGVA